MIWLWTCSTIPRTWDWLSKLPSQKLPLVDKPSGLPPASQWPGWCWDFHNQLLLLSQRKISFPCLHSKVITDNSCWITTQKYPFLLPLPLFRFVSLLSLLLSSPSFLLFILRPHFPLHFYFLRQTVFSCFCFHLQKKALFAFWKFNICLKRTVFWKHHQKEKHRWGVVRENLLLQWVSRSGSHPPPISKHPLCHLKAVGYPN